MQVKVWVRCLAWWGSPCVAWERHHQQHPFAFWQPSTDSELMDLLAEVRREHARAEEIEPGFSAVCDFNVRYVRAAFAN